MRGLQWPHGDLCDAELRELGFDAREVIDFAVNVDPRGPHPVVRQAIAEANVGRYPDPQARELVAELARRDAVTPERVRVGAGVTSLLWSLARAFAPGSPALVPAHAFHEYSAAAQAAGLRVTRCPRVSTKAFELDWDFMDDWAHRFGDMNPDQARAGICFLGAPDNPSGQLLDYERLARFARVHAGVCVAVDEAFLRLSEGHELILRELPDNVVRLRSLTKELAIPGLRVGYAVGAPLWLEAIGAQTPPWMVGAPAQAGALAALRVEGQAENARRWMRSQCVQLDAQLRDAGWQPLPSGTVFLLVPVAASASAWRSRLMREGILVRDCSSFGLPQHLRLCGRGAADRERLMTVMTRLRDTEDFR